VKIKTLVPKVLGLGILGAIVGFGMLSSCTSDLIRPVLCDSIKEIDSITVIYTCDVKPIIEANCTKTCHTGTYPAAGPELDSYDLVKTVADEGTLVDVIKHQGFLEPMPYPLKTPPLSDIDIAILEQWIADGTLP